VGDLEGNGDERHASRDDWRRDHFAANQLVERCDLFAANELVDRLIGKTGDDEACDDPVEPAAPVGPGRTRAVSSQFAGGADARLARPIGDCHAAALEFVGLSRRGVADNLGAGERQCWANGSGSQDLLAVLGAGPADHAGAAATGQVSGSSR
jgi:hypothetical protein